MLMNNTYKEEFKYTGNSVPINPTMVHAQVINLLDEYNDQLANDIVVDSNPFNDKIIASTPDGKLYEVPSYIQEKAIEIWLKNNLSTVDEENLNSTIPHSSLTYILVILSVILFGYFLALQYKL
jgi:hypothetical protein